MKNIKLVLILSLTISTLPVFCQNNLPKNYNKTLALFTKFENKLEKTKQAEIKERRFFSPVDSAVLFLEVLKKEAADLYNHTECYSESLLAILEKRDCSKNQDFCLNVIRILYHLKIDNYVNLLNEIYHNYKLNKVNSRIFLDAIFTCESYYSNLIVLNYKNPKLQLLLNKISSDSEIISKVSKVYPNFLKSINDIISGALFNEFHTTQKGWFFVYKIPNSELN
jgi:hypothetical protein